MVAGMWRNIPKIPWDSASLKCSLLKKWAHELWRSRVSHGNIPLLFFMCKVSAVHKVCKGCPAMWFYVGVFKTKTHRCSSGGTTSECNGAPS